MDVESTASLENLSGCVTNLTAWSQWGARQENPLLITDPCSLFSHNYDENPSFGSRIPWDPIFMHWKRSEKTRCAVFPFSSVTSCADSLLGEAGPPFLLQCLAPHECREPQLWVYLYIITIFGRITAHIIGKELESLKTFNRIYVYKPVSQAVNSNLIDTSRNCLNRLGHD